ncbi:MAG: hypothetical protein AB7P03_05170 [Kofleriaceae bacterium]
MTARVVAFAVAMVVAPAVFAQAPSHDVSATLRDANDASVRGDWLRVTQLVEPVLLRALGTADRAEAHRLAGLAAFFSNRASDAERHFVEYLKIEPFGHLDPALYPPEVVTFFDDVRVRHKAAIKPRPKRYVALSAIPVIGQFHNDQPVKGIVIASAIGVFGITNAVTYLTLRSWCQRVSGPDGSSATCDEGGNHRRAAQRLRIVNLVSGVALIGAIGAGVVDGVLTHYKQRRERTVLPYVAPDAAGATVGISARF